MLSRKREDTKQQFMIAGVTASAAYNAAPFRDKGAKLVSPLDFVPDFNKPRQQTIDEQIDILTRAFKCGPVKNAEA